MRIANALQPSVTATIIGSLASILLSSGALAKDFELPVLPTFENSYDLGVYSGKTAYYDLMKVTIEPKLVATATDATSDNEAALEAGKGVAVKLSEHNYDVHVNFPAGPQGGRSYGWTSGQVGDWSDQMYLQHLAQVEAENDTQDLNSFYQTIVRLLSSCNPQGIDDLAPATQRVATNFLAIYTAEEYRAMVPAGIKNWDDALLQVTMLGAFHGGQVKFTMFYEGNFTTQTQKQAAGVYTPTGPGPTGNTASNKPASLDDYWQFSKDPSSQRSGINETRRDFENMGRAITKYKAGLSSPALAQVQGIVGNSDNVIQTTSQFFSNGQFKDLSKADDLAKAVAAFLLEVRSNAEKITTWESNGEK